MLVAVLLVFQLIFASTYKFTIVEDSDDVHLCIGKIISSSKNRVKVTYIGNGEDDLKSIKFINNMNMATVISRTINSPIPADNEVYVIPNAEVNTLEEILKKLKHETRWRPDAKFIVLLSTYEHSIDKIFDTMLHYRVTDVVVVNGSMNPDLFTYNPFENNACGRVFNRISEAKCFEADLTKLLVLQTAGLKNCSLKALVTESPPFSSIADRKTRQSGNLGVEQYVMDILAELEHFKIDYIAYDYPEEFSYVDRNLSVHGPLRLVRDQEADLMMGSMVLLAERAEVFSYLWGHITFADELKVVVKRADVLPRWKDVYLEFDTTVWILILVTYLLFVKLVLLFLRQREKGVVVLMMMDYLFLHGSKLGNMSKTRRILLIWILFAYLISTYYQSSLTSLLAHPSMMYQIATESDLRAFNINPYFSRFYNRFSRQLIQKHTNESVGMECEIQFDCLKGVTESYSIYTIVLRSVYLQNIWRYRDARCNYLLYPFKEPWSKVIYAIYFDKGFPLVNRLHLHTLRIKESGLLEKYLDEFYRRIDKKGCSGHGNTYDAAIITWRILAVGYSLSAACFFVEIILGN